MQTILESLEWKELMNKELELGPELLLEKIMENRTWSNAELLWTIRRFVYYYALHDELLKKVPLNKLFDNFVSMMRAFYMIFDQANPDLDPNIRTYISTKIGEATWGINAGTRPYLQKVDK